MIVNLSKYATKSTPESHKSEDTFHSPVVLSPISGIEKRETVASCLSPVPARFLHFLLLNDFPPPSWRVEQATRGRFLDPRETSPSGDERAETSVFTG